MSVCVCMYAWMNGWIGMRHACTYPFACRLGIAIAIAMRVSWVFKGTWTCVNLGLEVHVRVK